MVFGCGESPMLNSVTACSLSVRMQQIKRRSRWMRRWINEMRKKAAGSGDYPHLPFSWLCLGFYSLGNTELSAQLGSMAQFLRRR